MNYLSKICMEEGNWSDFSSGGDLNHCNCVGKCADRRTDKRVHSHPCTYIDRWVSGRMGGRIDGQMNRLTGAKMDG